MDFVPIAPKGGALHALELMMAKSKTLYSCTECGAQATEWAGQCGDCGAWNTFIETIAVVETVGKGNRFAGYAGTAGGGVQLLADIQPGQEARHSVGIAELDRVAGRGAGYRIGNSDRG